MIPNNQNPAYKSLEGYEITSVTKFDPRRIDWLSVGIDVTSGSATAGAATCLESGGFGCAVGGVAEIATLAGITYSIAKAQNNSDTTGIAANIIANLSDYGRAVPVWGVGLSVVDVFNQVINHGFYTQDVLKPSH
jgi:hypothetical protein